LTTCLFISLFSSCIWVENFSLYVKQQSINIHILGDLWKLRLQLEMRIKWFESKTRATTITPTKMAHYEPLQVVFYMEGVWHFSIHGALIYIWS
jgi:hypothetical protein